MIPEKDEIDKILDSFETERAGLHQWTAMPAPKWLQMPIEELSKKTPQELAEASMDLRRYSLNIQRLINRTRSWQKWVKLKLDEVTAANLPNISGSYGWNGDLLVAKHNAENTRKLNQFLRKLEMEIESLYDIPRHVELIASSVDSIRFANFQKERHG